MLNFRERGRLPPLFQGEALTADIDSIHTEAARGGNSVAEQWAVRSNVVEEAVAVAAHEQRFQTINVKEQPRCES